MEFAVVTPLVVLLFFASFEFCRVSMIRHTADNAVYEAARRGIIPGGTATEARDKAASVLSSLGVQNVSITVVPTTIEKETREVTVRVRVPLDGNSFVPNQFFAGHTVERELTLLREGRQ